MKKLICQMLKTNGLVLLCLWLSLPDGVYAQKVRFTGKDNNWVAIHTYYVDGTTLFPRTFFFADTSILLNGMSYKALAQQRGGNDYVIEVLVREDTAARKVYFKSWDGDIYDYYAYIKDTAEFVAYDYGLNIGDTMMMPLVYGGNGATSMHILTAKDSVKINGVWHITQHFTCPFGFGYNRGYDVVEGVGSLTHPAIPGPSHKFENAFNLSCFSNGDTLNPSQITLSFPETIPRSSFRLVSFSSCGKLDIADRTLPGVEWKLSPNPATEEVIVNLWANAAGEVYDLRIHDVLGKVLYTGTVKRQLLIPLSGWAPGYYLVTLSDAKDRRSTKRLAVH